MRPPLTPPAPIPLTVLTGFLGAGKTTLLNHLLTDPGMAETLVLINEFGEIGLDHLLVEHVEDGLVLLSAGCLCCTIRGDLVSTLEDLLRRRDNNRIDPFRRVVIETTGLADPAPVLAAVLYHPYLSRRYAVQEVVTVVDAVNGPATLERHEEARRQVAVADRIVLTKTDLRGPGAESAIRDALARLNPRTPVLTALDGRVPAGELFSEGLFTPDGKIGDVRAWLQAETRAAHDHDHHHDHGHDHSHNHGHGHAHDHGHGHGHSHAHHHDVSRHDERIYSFVLTAGRPVGRGAIDMFLEMVRASFGPTILRLKGLIDLVEEPGRPLVIHGVQHVLHVPALLPAWPDADHRTRIVMIVEDVPEAAVLRMWQAFSGQPVLDAPDAAALTDNPLAPPTMARR